MKKSTKIIETSIILGILACLAAWHITNSVLAEPQRRTEPKQKNKDTRTPRNPAGTTENSRFRPNSTYVIPEVRQNSDSYYYEPQYRRAENLSVPAYQTDMDKITASYERILDRFINTMDRYAFEINGNSESIMNKLQIIEQKIDGIDFRLARIEDALNIEGDIPEPPH